MRYSAYQISSAFITFFTFICISGPATSLVVYEEDSLSLTCLSHTKLPKFAVVWKAFGSDGSQISLNASNDRRVELLTTKLFPYATVSCQTPDGQLLQEFYVKVKRGMLM